MRLIRVKPELHTKQSTVQKKNQHTHKTKKTIFRSLLRWPRRLGTARYINRTSASRATTISPHRCVPITSHSFYCAVFEFDPINVQSPCTCDATLTSLNEKMAQLVGAVDFGREFQSKRGARVCCGRGGGGGGRIICRIAHFARARSHTDGTDAQTHTQAGTPNPRGKIAARGGDGERFH